MAITDHVYQESLVGIATVPYSQGIYETSSTQKAPLGAKREMHDGRVYRYALNGATALTVGSPVSCIAQAAGAYDLLVQTAAAIGAKSVTVSSAAAFTTYGEGFMYVHDNTGQGCYYKVKKTAANATTSTYTDITLYDPLHTALDTTSEVGLINNLWDGVVAGQAETPIVGIAHIDVPLSEYFWCQVAGFGVGYATATTTIAAGLVIMEGGSTILSDSITDTGVSSASRPIAIPLEAGVADEFRAIFWKIGV